MKLSSMNQKILLKEIKTAFDLMNRAEMPQEKLYFFSAVYGVANRIMNIEYDPELVFLHNVTSLAHNTINTAISVASRGQSVSTLAPRVFESLQNAIKELIVFIEEEKPTYPALEKISNIAYSTCGNGYYLYLKGALKLP
jgi:hypothetical protein